MPKSLRITLFFILSTIFAFSSLAQDKYQPDIPASVALEVSKAKALRENGHPDQSVERLKPIIKRYPDYYLAHYNLALAYADSKEYPTAIEEFQAALKIKEEKNISEASIYNSIGATYIVMGDYKNAEAMLKKGEENAKSLSLPSKQKLFNSLGVLYLYKGNSTESEKYLRVSATDYGYKPAEKNLKILDNIKKDALKAQKGR